ncbi:MAG: dihydroneopterin triphosphate diphosphatase [Ferrovum sp.]|nr:dihydroneopterin triphosphate diphosphatase [Ferrovum sp.]NDU86691.1 dihydroneopterin triphosphate diphosphatase [Ferrovum sp.]
MTSYKIPESVLVVIYTRGGEVLLMERADAPGWWQSVTGSREHLEEGLGETARREVAEETGMNTAGRLENWHQSRVYEIFPRWRARYAPGVTHNVEHQFGVVLAAPAPVVLNPREHLRYLWLPWQEAAERCFSWTNREAILSLPERSMNVVDSIVLKKI